MRIGLTLFDFLASQRVAVNALPARFSNALETISLDIASEVETPAFMRWRGTLPAQAFLEKVLGGRAVGVETLSWRFTVERDPTTVPSGEVENPALARELRVQLAGVRVELPSDLGFPLHPADEVPPRGTDIAHLRRREGDERTALVGDLAFRIIQRADGQPEVGLAGADDPFRAFDETGAVAALRLDPPAAVFSEAADGFGIVVEGVQIDGSHAYTPPEIASGDPEWTGFRLERVGLYLPHSIPIFGNLSVVAEEFLVPVGDTARGLQGKATVETGRIAGTGATIRFSQTGFPIPPDRSLPVTQIRGAAYQVRYRRLFDDDRRPIPISILATSPVPEGVWQLWRDGVHADSQGGPSYGPFVPGPDDELRYIRLARPETGPEFRLLTRPDLTSPAGETGAFPAPAQTFSFVGVGAPPGALWQINVDTGDGAPLGNVAYLTGTVEDLSKLVFSLGDQGGNAPDVPVTWSIWAEGTMPGKGDAHALHRPGPAATLQWDGWTDGITASVIARVGGDEARRLLITPRPDGPLMLGHSERRSGSGVRPKITVVDQGGVRGIGASDVAADGIWRKKVLEEIQTKALFGMGQGATVDAQTPGAGGSFSVDPGDVLLVPTVFGIPAAPLAEEPARPVLKKRVLLMRYDTAEAVLMLDDGFDTTPAGSLTGSPGTPLSTPKWIARSARRPSATSGVVWPGDPKLSPKAANAQAAEAAAQKLSAWIIAQTLDPEKAVTLFVVAQTSPEGTKAHNEELSKDTRLPAGLAIARAAVALTDKALGDNAPVINIEGRAEHEARLDHEPAHFAGTAPSAPASRTAPQQVQPGSFARLGQIGELDSGVGDTTTDLWIGTRGDFRTPRFKIERNVTFVLAGTSQVKPPQQPPDTPRLVPVLVPGGEAELPEAVAVETNRTATPWRLRAEMVWDAPRYQDSDDLIPLRTKVELTLPRSVLPGIPESDPSSFSIMGQILRDRQLGETEVSLGIAAGDHPEGLMELSQDQISAGGIVFGMFGPALLKALSDDERDPDLPEEDAQAGLAGSIVAGTTVASAAIIADAMQDGRLVWTAARLSGTVPLGRAAIAVDYLTEANVVVAPESGDGPAVRTTEPVAFAWSDVGLSVDWRPETADVDLTGSAAYFRDARVEVVSSGRWTINNVLSDLVDLRDVQFDNTSAALSALVVPTKPLGPLKVDAIGLTVRWTDAPRKVTAHLTEVAATLDVEKVIEAHGAVAFGDGIRGTLSIDVPPAHLSGSASLAIVDDPDGGATMVHLEADIKFATPVPIGTTGLSVVGVAGRFVANGKRAVEETISDIVARELDWARKPAHHKYTPQAGQYAIGLGVFLGTAPDLGFALNAKGMLTVGFPDLEAVVQADVKLVERRAAAPSEDGPGPAEADILALLVVSDEGVTIAAEGNVTIPAQLKAYIPIGAHFPFGDGGFYIHLGSDGGPDRAGEPIKATIYPGTLSVDGWAFLMIREEGIPDLGGARADGVDLTGFAVGVGLGIGFDRSFGPLSVNASASLIAGIGFDPLIVAARLQLEGELDFFVASVHLSAGLDILYTPDRLKISGWIEGSVSLFLFDLEASVFLEETFGGTPETPQLPNVLRSLRVTDHRDRILAEADPTAPAPLMDVPVDAVINLEFFPTPLISNIAGFDLPTPAQIEASWVGSTGERYGFEVTDITLERLSGPAGSDLVMNQRPGPLPAQIIRPTDGHEGQADAGRALRLGLLANDPVPWLGNLSAQTALGESIAEDLAEGLCTPAERARDTLFGVDMTRTAPERWSARSRGPRPTSFVGRTRLHTQMLRQAETGFAQITGVPLPPDDPLSLQTLRATVLGSGFALGPAERAERGPAIFPAFPQGAMLLPCLTRDGTPAMSLPMQLDLRGELRDPTLTLLTDPAAEDLARENVKPEKFCPDRLKPSPRKVQKRGVDRVIYETRGTGFLVDDDPGRIQNPVRFGGASADMLEITFPQDGEGFEFQLEATATVFNGALQMSIHDRNGAQLWSERITLRRGQTDIVDRLPLTPRAASLRLLPLRLDVTLRHVCQITRLARIGSPEPRIFGVDHRGTLVSWVVTRTGRTGGPTGFGGTTWAAAPTASGARWKAVVFAPVSFSWVAFETLSGLSVTADDAAAARDARRSARAGNYTARAVNTASPTPNAVGISGDIPVLDTVPPAARPPLLFPDSTYRLTLKSRGAIWRKSADSEAAPQRVADGFAPTPPPGVAAPEALPDIVVDFTTAPPAQALERAKASFDRALPDDARGAHYTDDAMAVLFTSTIAPELINLAGHMLKFRLRRTDPRGGAREVSPDAMRLTRTGGNRDDWPGQMGAFADALAKGAPCVAGTPTAGETMVLDAPLDPDATYRLDIMSEDAAGAEEAFGYARFRTSRYADPVAQLQDMGLRQDTPVLLPDQLVQSHPAPRSAPPSDLAFEDAAVALGLDPEPPRDPLAQALWTFDGGWKLSGVRLCSPEALDRQAVLFDATGVSRSQQRLALEGVTLVAPGVETALRLIQRDAQGARWIYAFERPLAVPDGAQIRVTLAQGGHVWRNGRLQPRPSELIVHAGLRPAPLIAEIEGLV